MSCRDNNQNKNKNNSNHFMEIKVLEVKTELEKVQSYLREQHKLKKQLNTK